MKDTKTYCFGRFLIDLPKAAEVNGQAYEFMFGKIEMEQLPKGEVAFAQRMKAREDELRKIKEDDGQSLKEVRHASTKNLRLFRTAEMVFKELDYGFEAYRLAGTTLFSMRETHFDKDKIKR